MVERLPSAGIKPWVWSLLWKKGKKVAIKWDLDQSSEHSETYQNKMYQFPLGIWKIEALFVFRVILNLHTQDIREIKYNIKIKKGDIGIKEMSRQ